MLAFCRKRKLLKGGFFHYSSAPHWFKPLDNGTMCVWMRVRSQFLHMLHRKRCRPTWFPKTLRGPSLSTSAVCFMTLIMTLKVVTMQGISTKLSHIIKQCCYGFESSSMCLASMLNLLDSIVSPFCFWLAEVQGQLFGRISRTINCLTSPLITQLHITKTCSDLYSVYVLWDGLHGVQGWLKQ